MYQHSEARIFAFGRIKDVLKCGFPLHFSSCIELSRRKNNTRPEYCSLSPLAPEYCSLPRIQKKDGNAHWKPQFAITMFLAQVREMPTMPCNVYTNTVLFLAADKEVGIAVKFVLCGTRLFAEQRRNYHSTMKRNFDKRHQRIRILNLEALI